uniref:NADH-ubiquinone oxidoreductase chain 4L n=1 Tax=Diptera sp. 66 LC-2017 TaxID=2030344 RepID=A0A343LA02_9DIPT|nr:NADH dehydrogenase subunit 4L [Diptera sp. 66 LC-2017]
MYLCFFFFSGMMVFFFNFKILLINLLSIEFMMMSIFLNLFLNLILFNFEMFFLMVLLSFMVCEGVLGLSLMILMIRKLGNSNLQFMNLLKN